MTESIGYATMQVIPSFKGTEASVNKLFGGVGRDAGRHIGDGLASGAQTGVGRIRQIISSGLASLGAVGVGAGILIGKTILDGLDQERLSDRLGAQLDMGERSAALGKIAGRLYGNNFGESFGEVTNAIRQSMQSGLIPAGSSDAEIENITGRALQLADVFEMDLGSSINAAAQLIRTGLAKDGVEALDLIGRAAQAGADKAGDLADSFIEYSTQFRRLGLSGAQAAGLMTQGVRAGARDADIVADSLKEFAIRSQEAMTTQTVVANTSVAAYGRLKTASKSVIDTRRNELLAEKALLDLRKSAADQLKELGEQMTDANLSERSSTLALQRARERLAALDPNASQLDREEAQLAVDQAVRGLEEQKQRVAELSATKAKADAAGVDGNEDVLNGFYGLLEAQQQRADAEKDELTAQAELRSSFGGTITTLTDMGKAYQRLGLDGTQIQKDIAAGGPRAAGALDSVLDALRAVSDPSLRNQLAVQIFGTQAEDMADAINSLDVTTAEAALGDHEKTIDDTGAAYDNARTKIDAFLRGGLEKATVFLSDKLLPVLDDLSKNEGVQKLIAGISDGARYLAANLPGWITTFTHGVEKFVEWIPQWITTFQHGWQRIREIFNNAVLWILDFWDRSGLDSVIGGTINLIVNIFKGAFEVIEGLWNTFAGLFTGDWSQMWEGIKGIFSGVWMWISDIFGRLWDGLLEILGLALDGMWLYIKDTFGGIVSFIAGIGTKLASAALGMWTWVASGVSDVTGWIFNTWNSIVDWFRSLPSRIWNAATGLFDGIKDSFKAAINWIVDTWNSIGFKLPTLDLGPLGKVGGWEVGPKYNESLQLPNFHTGGMIGTDLTGDEVVVKALKDESILRPEQVRTLAQGGATRTVILKPEFHGPVAGRDGERWVAETMQRAVERGLAS